MSLDMERLLDAVRKIESNDNPNAVSPVGAKGPYQFMDATAAEYGVANPFDETQSRAGAKKYLENLINQFGSTEKALAAYNGGPGRLARRGGEIARMPQESRDYVQKVMAQYASLSATTSAQVGEFQARQASTTNTLFPGEAARRREIAGSLFPNNYENDALRESLLNPKPVNEAQRIYNLQKRTGLPTGLIERNLDSLEKEVANVDFDAEKFRRESPMLSEWIAANPTRAALAQGDYENLSALEKAWSVFKAIPEGGKQGWLKEESMKLGAKAVKGTITPQEQIRRKQLDLELRELGEQYDEGAPSWTKAAADVVGMQIPMGIEAISKGVKYGLPAGAASGAVLGLIGGPGAPVTVTAGAAAGGLTGIKMVSYASYAEQTYDMALGEAYGELETAVSEDGIPIDPDAARYASMVVAVPNAMMEFASLRMALKVIPGADAVLGKLTAKQMKQLLVKPTVMAAINKIGKRYAAAVGTETFTEGMQAVNTILAREIATGDMGAGVDQGDAESVIAQSTEAFKASVVLGGLSSGPKVIEAYAQMEKAAQNEQFMAALGETVANSKTHANSPAALASYIEHLKKNGPVKDVLIPIEQWDKLFQAEAPDAAKEVFGTNEQYAEAKATGSDLVIPLETYTEKLAGTPFHQQLLPNMRLGAGEMTSTEALEMEQAEPEIVAGLLQEMAEMEAKEAPMQEIYNDVSGKLRDLGVSSYEANRGATLWREHMRAMSELTGKDALELYQQKPLDIQRELPKAVDKQVKKFNQRLVEPPVPFAQKLPLEGGSINLPPATELETGAAKETFEAGSTSQQEFGVFGATIHPQKGNLAGTQGVAVAGYPQRGVVTEGAPSAADLEVFMRRNRDIFEKDATAALGVWVDSETGKGYIDITNVLPRAVAIAQGEAMGEKAVWDLEAFEEIRLPTQREEGQQQKLFQKSRGSSVPAQNLITLSQSADPSTFVHESAHLWLEEMREFAMQPDALPALKQHWETIKEWTGATDAKISTEAHEMFARGFEAYVMEGQAPSFQLREVFSQLMDWMLRIYKSMSMLDVKLTDEVRDVFDHLVATDTAIKQARGRHDYDTLMFEEGEISEAEMGAYRQLQEEAKRTAEDHFRAKVMKELKREKLKSWRDEKKALQPKVRAEILEEPIYRVAYWLWSGKLPDGSVMEGVESTKLDTQALQDLGVSPQDLPFRHKKNGLNPDVVAEIFGFPSGESMVKELIGLPTLKEAIDNEVNRRIREEHGGIVVEGTTVEEAAMEVQNTQQIDVFNMELRILKRLGAKREKTHPAVMKDIARQVISRKKLRDLNPRLYEEAAIKAGQEAQDALLGQEFRTGTGRNLDVAFDAKQKQILNIMLFKEATEQRKKADKAVRKWKKFLFRKDERVAKTRDMNMVNAARAIASVHGIGGAQETADTYMETLKQYDKRTYDDLIGLVKMASSDGRKADDLTVADFTTVNDAIEGLWNQALRSQQVNIDGVKMDKTNVIGGLNTRIDELVKPGRKRAGYESKVSAWEKTKMGLLGAKAMLTRVEHWVDAMDNGDPNGVFRRYIWQPISEASDQFRDQRRIYLEKYQAVVEAVPKGAFKPGKIDAPEIGYVFSDTTELVGAMLHTGNQSSLEKLLIAGRGPDKSWGAFDQNGNLDSRKWDAMVKRLQSEGVLTEDHYDFMQAVGDLFEEMKPAAQKAHKEVFGYYFSEIAAKPISTPFGNYRGWYYPAAPDPLIVEDAAIRQEQEAMETQPNSFIFPDTGHGFTKQRSAGYHAALNLDTGMIQQHIEKVLRFTTLEAPTKDVAKLLTDKGFRNHLAALDSEVGAVMLMPWLQRSALQQVEQPSGPRMRLLDKAAHYFRTTAGGMIMIGNVSVALQQSTGLSLAAVKVEPRYLAGALTRFTASPTATVESIHGASAFMRNRVTTSMMDIQKSIDNILLNPSTTQKVRNFANEHGYFMTVAMQNVVDYTTWGGAYEQATAERHGEKAAVRIADSAVRETQGTFAAEDISRFEAGTPVIRAFTMFYSFFNMAANLQVAEFTKAMRLKGFKGAGRALYVHAMGFAIPGIMAYAITEALRGELFDDDDDDGYLDTMLGVMGWGYLSMGTPMVPVLGPALQSGLNRFNDKWYDDRINVSPAVSVLESVGGNAINAYKLATEENVRLKRPIKDALTLISLASGVPVAPLAKPIGYLTDIAQGEIEEPSNPVEIARGLVSGVAPQ